MLVGHTRSSKGGVKPAAAAAAPRLPGGASDYDERSEPLWTAVLRVQRSELSAQPLRDAVWRRCGPTSVDRAILFGCGGSSGGGASAGAAAGEGSLRMAGVLQLLVRTVKYMMASGRTFLPDGVVYTSVADEGVVFEVLVRNPLLYQRLLRWWNSAVARGSPAARGLSRAQYCWFVERLLAVLCPFVRAPAPYADAAAVAEKDWRRDHVKGACVQIKDFVLSLFHVASVFVPSANPSNGGFDALPRKCAFLDELHPLVFGADAAAAAAASSEENSLPSLRAFETGSGDDGCGSGAATSFFEAISLREAVEPQQATAAEDGAAGCSRELLSFYAGSRTEGSVSCAALLQALPRPATGWQRPRDDVAAAAATATAATLPRRAATPGLVLPRRIAQDVEAMGKLVKPQLRRTPPRQEGSAVEGVIRRRNGSGSAGAGGGRLPVQLRQRPASSLCGELLLLNGGTAGGGGSTSPPPPPVSRRQIAQPPPPPPPPPLPAESAAAAAAVVRRCATTPPAFAMRGKGLTMPAASSSVAAAAGVPPPQQAHLPGFSLPAAVQAAVEKQQHHQRRRRRRRRSSPPLPPPSRMFQHRVRRQGGGALRVWAEHQREWVEAAAAAATPLEVVAKTRLRPVGGEEGGGRVRTRTCRLRWPPRLEALWGHFPEVVTGATPHEVVLPCEGTRLPVHNDEMLAELYKANEYRPLPLEVVPVVGMDVDS